MSVGAINSSGTVIGSIPVNGSGNESNQPYRDNDRLRGEIPRWPILAVRPSAPPSDSGPNGQLYLSQSNQILIWDNSHVSASLLNVATGTTTPISQLFPPALLQQLTGSPTGATSFFQGKGIDDRGDVLVTVGLLPGFRQTETFILTPPGLAPPTSTPEPSSLLIFGMIAGGMGLRAVVTRSRNRTDG